MKERSYLLTPDHHLVKNSSNLKDVLHVPASGVKSFVVGEGIAPYLDKLRMLGFENYWTTKDKHEYVIYDRALHNYKDMDYSGRLMYSYIDFVINDSGGELFIFLPEGGYFESDIKGYTFYEIERAIYHLPKHEKRINFVNGLFDLHPDDFATKY